MVVFTCNHCGETLHKPSVAKHYQFQCKNYKSITCVDCFKDFLDEEYVAHTKCITEDERYAAKGAYQNGIVKKGEVKQESWLEMIKSISESEKNLRPSLKNLLNTISSYSNVPRKKVKFMNFIKSSSGGRVNINDIEEVWSLIEKYKEKNTLDKQKIADKNGNKPNDEIQSKVDNRENSNVTKKRKTPDIEKNSLKDNQEHLQKKKKKRKDEENIHNVEEINAVNVNIQDITCKNFNMKQEILEILNLKKDISLKKLQKKVLKAYVNSVGEIECQEKIVKKFNKKLSKITNIKIEDDRISLII
ncbi:cell growth-regulating nucleolar protein [Sitophilus oryzae]|uniref:Cell growth-regulating nucleolar protein n=1 Tax=Sitophilus oryzae TaxID=7048 RepID=A0A6J2XNZ0_SITOR|nr:cell growth-regulating nucleolar protein [Sitophilus oryzae]